MQISPPINFIKGTSAGKLDSFPLDFVSLIFPQVTNADP